jgi:hypothetical protein
MVRALQRVDGLRRGLLLLIAAVMVVVLPWPGGPVALPESSGYGVRCLAVGAWAEFTHPSHTADLGGFTAADRAMGPLTMRRSFDSSLPADFESSAAAGDPAAGVHSFTSWKPPNGDHRGAAAGRYDRRITAWARSVPTTGIFATAFHEPENDMTAPEFVAFQRHVYRVVKDANPTIRWGPVYMAYWWDPAATDHYVGDPAAWWPGEDYADFVGVDWYGADPEPMTASPSFRHWYDVMAPTGLPLVVAEYGQAVVRPGRLADPARQQARVAAIRQDAAWIAEHPEVTGWLYWQGRGPRGDWRLADQASQAAWRAVAETGCRPKS